MADQSEEPKLIIDEDWKTRIQREKAELEQKQAAQEESPTDATAINDAAQAVVETPPEPTEEKLPPASLPMLVASLGTQAMGAMGIVPGDDGQPLPVNLAFAKHFIDLLGVLEEKTSGNLSEQEKQYLQETLYQLRMAYVEVKKTPR